MLNIKSWIFFIFLYNYRYWICKKEVINMTLKIAAVCDDKLSGEMLKEAGNKLGLVVNYEV